jgi:hypothetical protein
MGCVGVAGSVAPQFPCSSGCECSIWLGGLGTHPLRLLLSADPRGRFRQAPRHRATCMAIWLGSRVAVCNSRRALSLRPEQPSEAMAGHPGRAGCRSASRLVAAPIGAGEALARRRGGRGCGLRCAVVRHLPRRARRLDRGAHTRAAARHVASRLAPHLADSRNRRRRRAEPKMGTEPMTYALPRWATRRSSVLNSVEASLVPIEQRLRVDGGRWNTMDTTRISVGVRLSGGQLVAFPHRESVSAANVPSRRNLSA